MLARRIGATAARLPEPIQPAPTNSFAFFIMGRDEAEGIPGDQFSGDSFLVSAAQSVQLEPRARAVAVGAVE